MEPQSPVASTDCATPFHDIYTGCQPNISRAILPGESRPTSGAPPTDTPILAQPARSQATKLGVGDPITFLDSDPTITFVKVIVTLYPLLWIRLLFVSLRYGLSDYKIASPSIRRYDWIHVWCTHRVPPTTHCYMCIHRVLMWIPVHHVSSPASVIVK